MDYQLKIRATWIDALFASDSTLRPTVGQVIRTKNSNPPIKSYFEDYFSKSNISALQVVNAQYNVVQLTSQLFTNYAYVKFNTSDNGDKVTAVMSFIWRKNNQNCWEIVLLHSSPIFLEVPEELKNNGDVFSLWSLQKPYGQI